MRQRNGNTLGRRCFVLLASGALLATPAFASAQLPSAGAAPVVQAPARERLPLGAPRGATAPGAAAVESAPQAPAGMGSVTRTVLSLAAVLGLIVVAGLVTRTVMRRTGGLAGAVGAGGKAPSGVLHVLARYPVARGTTLVVLKFDRRVLLTCMTGSGGVRGGASMSTLCELTDPEEVASVLVKCGGEEQAAMSAKFQAMLREEDDRAERAMHAPAQRTSDAGTRGTPRTASLTLGEADGSAMARQLQARLGGVAGGRDARARGTGMGGGGGLLA